MKDYRDLKIIANTSEQAQLIEIIEKSFNNSGWKRNIEKEQEHNTKHSSLIGACFIFTCSKTEARPAVE